jgi:hypothetical protein
MPQFRHLVNSFSLMRQGFNCKIIQVVTVVDEVAMEQICLLSLQFSFKITWFLDFYSPLCKKELDVHGSVHRYIKIS